MINVEYLEGYAGAIIGIINGILMPVLLSVAFIYFLYGVYKYFILGADKEDDLATGRQFILWGVIGFVVIFSVWGLVAIVSGTLGLTPGGSAPNAPFL